LKENTKNVIFSKQFIVTGRDTIERLMQALAAPFIPIS